MLNDLLYVLAGRADEAKLFAESRNVPFMKMRFIDRPDKIRGLRNIKLHVLSSASEREDFHEIMQEAKYRCFEIENV